MAAARNIDAVRSGKQAQEPPAELLPFLDALAELLAQQILQDLQKAGDQPESGREPRVAARLLRSQRAVE